MYADKGLQTVTQWNALLIFYMILPIVVLSLGTTGALLTALAYRAGRKSSWIGELLYLDFCTDVLTGVCAIIQVTCIGLHSAWPQSAYIAWLMYLLYLPTYSLLGMSTYVQAVVVSTNSATIFRAGSGPSCCCKSSASPEDAGLVDWIVIQLLA